MLFPSTTLNWDTLRFTQATVKSTISQNNFRHCLVELFPVGKTTFLQTAVLQVTVFLGPSHITTEKFENGDFTLKTHQMFSVYIAPEGFKTAKITGHFDLCLRKPRSGKSRDYRDVIVFENLRLQNVFRPHENENPAFTNSSRLKTVFVTA